VKKFSRRNAAFSSRVPGLVALALCAAACGPHYPGGEVVRGSEACVRADTFFAAVFPRPQTMRGRATFDVDSYRVRGRFELRMLADGGAVLEFSGTTLLGGHREDVVVSQFGDTLRVLDRERGRYYEGTEVGRMIEGGTHAKGDWSLGLRRVLASSCPGIETIRLAEEGLSGTGPDGPFELRTESGRLVTATWPNPAPGDTYRDRLEVRYRWGNGVLQFMEVRLPVRGWRIRLEADGT
jgi:hypothetical protein